jgi:hypothetical protein
MAKFSWGKVIERFVYDFDGKEVEVIKYYPDKFIDGHHAKGEYESRPAFHIDSLNASAYTLDEIIITWIAKERLGLNQHTLVSGICRALCIE